MNNDVTLDFVDGMPFAKRGIPVSQVSFSGGRTTADIAAHGGLTHVRYFGNQPHSKSELFTADPISAWTQLFRLFVKIDGDVYYTEFNDTTFFPFGYESFCEIDGVRIRHDLILLNDELTVSAQIISGGEGRRVSFGWHITECAVKKGNPTRVWSDLSYDPERRLLTCEILDKTPPANKKIALTQKAAFGYTEPEETSTFIAVGASSPMSVRQTGDEFKKSYLYADAEADGKVLFVLRFATAREDALALDAERSRLARDKFLSEFDAMLANQPKFITDDACLASFAANAAPLARSLQVSDIPGGYRAADSGYWIWGWDSMVHCDSQLLAGDSDGVLDMLRFYRDTAHPEFGIFHSLSVSGKPMLAMAPGAQTLYAVVLYRHYCFTRDKDVLREFHPFAKKLVERALLDEERDCGLVAGVALYPDFPEDLDQNGHDISSFNNGVLYQALRSLSVCAEVLGASTDAETYAAKAAKLKVAFNTLLFDDEVGYYYDSIDSRDFSPRKHYPVYAVLDTSPFAIELVGDNLAKIAAFMKANLTKAKYGLTLVPRSDPNFMIDGNQIGMYMPVVEGFYRRVMYEMGDYEEAGKFIPILKWAWNQISVPESLACEGINNGVTLDNPGRKQWFCHKAWHSLLFRLGLGLEVDHNGISQFHPLLDNLEVRDVKAAGERFTLSVKNGASTKKDIRVDIPPIDAIL